MPADAHCHLRDLAERLPDAEGERRKRGVICAASAWGARDFAYQEEVKRGAAAVGSAAVYCCFGVHPQLPAKAEPAEVAASLGLLEEAAAQGRLDGIGETGFDLFDAGFRETETAQERLFEAHLALALRYDLPVVLHIRKAMHKVFGYAKTLKPLRSVIFHAYPGTPADGAALLRRGINAYFSFGNALCTGRKESARSCAELPADRLLAETDAPYQPRRGAAFSHWEDLPLICRAIARLRTTPFGEANLEENFRRAYAEYPHAPAQRPQQRPGASAEVPADRAIVP